MSLLAISTFRMCRYGGGYSMERVGRWNLDVSLAQPLLTPNPTTRPHRNVRANETRARAIMPRVSSPPEGSGKLVRSRMALALELLLVMGPASFGSPGNGG